MTEGRVLIVGGTGVVGGAVLAAALDRQLPVTALVRDASRLDPGLRQRARVIEGDLAAAERLTDAVKDVAIVINCAGVLDDPRGVAIFREGNVEGPRRLLRSAGRAGANFFVHMSSASVYGTPPGTAVDEDARLEEHPEWRGLYTATKLEGENGVRQEATAAGMGLAVLRPGTVYGDGSPLPIGRLAVGLPGRRALIVGSRTTPLSLTHSMNLADVVLACIARRQAGTWNVVDDEDLTQENWLRVRRRVLGDAARATYLPLSLALAAARLLGPLIGQRQLAYRMRRTCHPFRLVAARVRRDLGWRPRLALEEALSITTAGRSAATAGSDEA